MVCKIKEVDYVLPEGKFSKDKKTFLTTEGKKIRTDKTIFLWGTSYKYVITFSKPRLLINKTNGAMRAKARGQSKYLDINRHPEFKEMFFEADGNEKAVIFWLKKNIF